MFSKCVICEEMNGFDPEGRMTFGWVCSHCISEYNKSQEFIRKWNQKERQLETIQCPLDPCDFSGNRQKLFIHLRKDHIKQEILEYVVEDMV